MILSILRMNGGGDPQVAAALRGLCDMTAGRPGCRGCEVLRPVDHPEQLVYIEQWDSWDALRAHMRCEVYAYLLQVLELSVDRPELEFREAGAAQGLKLVEAVRLGQPDPLSAASHVPV